MKSIKHEKYHLIALVEEINGEFKSCRIHRIYELNAHERHHKVVIKSGKLFSLRKHLGRSQRLKICSVINIVEMN